MSRCCLPYSAFHSDHHYYLSDAAKYSYWREFVILSSHFVTIFLVSFTSYNSLSLTPHNPVRHGALIVGQVAQPLFKMSLILIATSEANPNCEGVQSVTF